MVYKWINQSFLPLIVKGELMDMSRGRSISREAASSHAAAVEVLEVSADWLTCLMKSET